MPDWLSIVVGVASALATVIGLGVMFAKPLLRIGRILRAVDGEKDRPGLLQEFRTLSTAITKLDRAMTDMVAAHEADRSRIAALESRFDRHMEEGHTP